MKKTALVFMFIINLISSCKGQNNELKNEEKLSSPEINFFIDSRSTQFL